MSYFPPTLTIINGDNKNTASNDAIFDALALKANQAPFRQTIVTLTDASTIMVDAALGNIFRVTLGGNRALGAPINAVDGQMLSFEISQDSTGGRTLDLTNSIFRFSADLPLPTLSTGANKLDRLLFQYNSSANKFDCIAINKGF